MNLRPRSSQVSSCNCRSSRSSRTHERTGHKLSFLIDKIQMMSDKQTETSNQSTYSTHTFQVGRFACVAIDDGGLTYGPPIFPKPADFFFADAPEEELNVALKGHGIDRDKWESIHTPYTCLLIDTGEHRVLVDTGDFAPSTGNLLRALASLGTSPADIDAIIITHGHCDHLNGCANKEGAPIYPKADYIMSEKEHSFWTSSKCKEMLDSGLADTLIAIARGQLDAIEQQLELITEATEVVPGIIAHPAYGHTPGHLVVEVKGGTGRDDTLYVLGDSIIHPLHCQCPHFSAIVDVERKNAIKTRRELMQMLSKEGYLVQLYHFPFPGLGYIEDTGKGTFTFRSYKYNEKSPQ